MIDQSDIFRAVNLGDVDGVRRQLHQNPNLVNQKNTLSQTPLFIAASQGKRDLVSEMLKAPSRDVIDVGILDIWGRDALDAATDCNHQQIVDLLTPIFAADAVGEGGLMQREVEERGGAALVDKMRWRFHAVLGSSPRLRGWSVGLVVAGLALGIVVASILMTFFLQPDSWSSKLKAQILDLEKEVSDLWLENQRLRGERRGWVAQTYSPIGLEGPISRFSVRSMVNGGRKSCVIRLTIKERQCEIGIEEGSEHPVPVDSDIPCSIEVEKALGRSKFGEELYRNAYSVCFIQRDP